MLTSPQETRQKEIRIQYFAVLREQRGLSEETRHTQASTPEELYHQLQKEHAFHLPLKQLRVAVNHQFCDLDQPLNDNDHVVFIPPVAGG